MSRLLDQLRRQLHASKPNEADGETLSRLAIYLARRGDNDEATVHIANLRRQANSLNQQGCIARANLAEGVLAFCTGNQVGALDKFRRAKALAELLGSRSLLNFSLAWLCHAELNLAKLDSIAAQIQIVLANAAPDEHSTLSRVGLTLAVALHTCDLYDRARPWYEFARIHAIAEGDDLTLDALLHNVAALRLHNLRLDDVCGAVDKSQMHRAELELNSGINYDLMKAPQSYRWMFPFLRTQLLMLQGQFAEAKDALVDWLSVHSELAVTRAKDLGHLDLAYCLALEGDLSAANVQQEQSRTTPTADLSPDDQAIRAHRLFQLASLNGDEQAAMSLRANALTYFDQSRAERRALASALVNIANPVSSHHS